MANRFPLIVDSSGTAAIKELASGDNLDLTGNSIVGVGAHQPNRGRLSRY